MISILSAMIILLTLAVLTYCIRKVRNDSK